MRFRKKPVEIDAVHWDGTNIDEVLELVDFEKLPAELAEGPDGPGIGHTPATGDLYIPTLEGTMTARAGDWIIKGVQGELYPCKPDIFAATYEPVEVAEERCRICGGTDGQHDGAAHDARAADMP